jgi:hypothetical protein
MIDVSRDAPACMRQIWMGVWDKDCTPSQDPSTFSAELLSQPGTEFGLWIQVFQDRLPGHSVIHYYSFIIYGVLTMDHRSTISTLTSRHFYQPHCIDEETALKSLGGLLVSGKVGLLMQVHVAPTCIFLTLLPFISHLLGALLKDPSFAQSLCVC